MKYLVRRWVDNTYQVTIPEGMAGRFRLHTMSHDSFRLLVKRYAVLVTVLGSEFEHGIIWFEVYEKL